MPYSPHALQVKTAVPADAAEMVEIYRPYVEDTAITFEYAVPSVKEFKQRLENVLKRYPWLTVRERENGRMLGYVYASPFKERAAYEYSVETSIYVRQDVRRQGAGRMLYHVLEALLAAQHVINLNACVAYDATEGQDEHLDNASVFFHQQMGYTQCAHFHQCGFKFGRWYDMVWLEKMLTEHPLRPELFVPFAKLANVRSIIAAAVADFR
ncbi:MAG: N-acetyltransferase [Proteobacteria bacterium]|uniref:N-acetyltransferase n=1 Tax=Candidatus Avisuccinivibrio stercorigallinarum TaxID=2840704 RepID=A0A9D9GT37_9GAMM|nr:N-acetyltransferase [Candidatus Avisuccinivibrio stercorigallinarum]